jgi:hypothetical protein
MPNSSHNTRVRLRSLLGAGFALIAAFAVLLALPLTSLGAGQSSPSLGSGLTGILNGVATGLQSTVQHTLAPASHSGTVARSSGSVGQSKPAATPSVAPAQSSGSSYVPPTYGTNPHGQGSVASVGLNPSSNDVYSYSPGGSSNDGEDVVAGRGRSEQNADGSYDAQETILGLFGDDLIPEEATAGQSQTGPLNSVQTGILDQLCNSTNEAICLTVLASDASATNSGADTHFELTSGPAHSGSVRLKPGKISYEPQL